MTFIVIVISFATHIVKLLISPMQPEASKPTCCNYALTFYMLFKPMNQQNKILKCSFKAEQETSAHRVIMVFWLVTLFLVSVQFLCLAPSCKYQLLTCSMELHLVPL